MSPIQENNIINMEQTEMLFIELITRASKNKKKDKGVLMFIHSLSPDRRAARLIGANYKEI